MPALRDPHLDKSASGHSSCASHRACPHEHVIEDGIVAEDRQLLPEHFIASQLREENLLAHAVNANLHCVVLYQIERGMEVWTFEIDAGHPVVRGPLAVCDVDLNACA